MNSLRVGRDSGRDGAARDGLVRAVGEKDLLGHLVRKLEDLGGADKRHPLNVHEVKKFTFCLSADARDAARIKALSHFIL